MTVVYSALDDGRYLRGLVPLTIGVTGHRDLVLQELPGIRELVSSFLVELQERFPDRPLEVLSPLAEGADRLVAEVALELGLLLAVPLPMQRQAYLADFRTEASRRRFGALCDRAETVYELPPAPDAARAASPAQEERDRQYAQLGVFLSAHSHILLALWDGKPSDELGGTAQVVRFHHDDVMSGYASSRPISQQLLADDESDLVYHIVVSRDRRDGAPADGLEPLSCTWLTTDEVEPRTAELPRAYASIFERNSEFNRDARKHRRHIEEECEPLQNGETILPVATETINRLFCAADWLAGYYQRWMLGTLRLTHGLAFLMGMMFILYSDVAARRYFMIAFFVCFAVALVAHAAASLGDWQSKHLEYRALAEGLRVQFYWAAAGVTSETVTKYSHDNFLQKQDIELGWIRNVMRAAGISCDVAPNLDPRGLGFVIREWIGEDGIGGQLDYYRSKAARYIARDRHAELLGRFVAVAVPIMLVVMFVVSSDDIRDPLFIALGAMLLLMSVRQAYVYRIAEKEVIRQYEFMYRIFKNARRRLEMVSNDIDRRRILRALGESALDEHAEWILLHRDRPLVQSGLWRMEA